VAVSAQGPRRGASRASSSAPRAHRPVGSERQKKVFCRSTGGLASPLARGGSPNRAALPRDVGLTAPTPQNRWHLCSTCGDFTVLRAGPMAALPLPSAPAGRQDGTYRSSEDASAALSQCQDPLLKMMPLQPLGQRPQPSLYFGS